ncbi:MAG: cell division protein SepF [Candidatus Methanofastidiosia archaeon]
MRKLSNIFGGTDEENQKVRGEAKQKMQTYPEDSLEEEENVSPGLKDVSQVHYDEDMLNDEKFFDYGVTHVKTIKLRSLADVQKISHELNEGSVIIADISMLNDRDPIELKRTIDQIKGICRGIGGDIAGIGDTMHVIITPSNIKIWREKV